MSRHIFLLIFSVLFISYAQALGAFDSDQTELNSDQTELYEITGKVRLVGNEPFSELVITDKKGKDYIISKEDYSLFKNLVHEVITVSSKVETDTLHSADGKYTIIRYSLISPVIIDENGNLDYP